MRNPGPLRTLGIAFIVALVCSVIVSVTAVTLKPRIDTNRLRHSTANLFEVLESLGASTPTPRWVERATGTAVERASDAQSALSPAQDMAGLGSVNDVLAVYEVRTGARLDLLVLPVRGAGYKSMLEGYLVLHGDLNTIAALTFHQQDETPGMGSLIVEKEWQALWADKQIADANGAVRIEVVKGASTGPYEVDGISGATRTGTGVSKLLRFWLGHDGYGPYLARLKREAAQ